MDFNKLLNNVNNPSWCTDTDGIEEAKNLIGQGSNGAWWYGNSIGGPNTRVYFSDHFLYVVREALSTDCTDNMFEDEAYVFFDYVYYVDCTTSDGACTQYNTPLDVLEALDKWIVDEIQCIPHVVTNGCETEHVYNTCSTV